MTDTLYAHLGELARQRKQQLDYRITHRPAKVKPPKPPRTHCVSGRHTWTPDNLMRKDDGFTTCRLCRNETNRQWNARRKQQ